MSLQGHFVLWCSAVVVAALAPTLVRAYALYLERGSRARAERLCEEVRLALEESSRAEAKRGARDPRHGNERTT